MAGDIQKLFNEDLPTQLAKNPDGVRAIGGKFQINITGDGGGEWFIDASDTGPSVMPGQGPADITITLTAEDFEKLQENPQTNGMVLFNGGKSRATRCWRKSSANSSNWGRPSPLEPAKFQPISMI
jgi:hypothetical protein